MGIPNWLLEIGRWLILALLIAVIYFSLRWWRYPDEPDGSASTPSDDIA